MNNMMLPISRISMLLLLAVVVLCSLVFTVTEALGRRELASYCVKLDKKLARHQKDSSDSPATYNLAMWYVESIFNAGRWDRRLLAESWDMVTFRPKKCSAKSFDYVNTIGQCAPERLKTLEYTLNKDTRRYVTSCFTPDFMDRHLKKAMRGPWVLEHPRALERFLSDSFLSTYKETNSDEGSLKANCCEPARSVKALIKAIGDVLARKKKAQPADYFKGRSKRVTKFLRRHLYKPCGDYIKTLLPIMRGTLAAGKYYEGNLEAFLATQSVAFQNSFFRYQFCQNLRSKKLRKQLAEQVIAELQ